ncbi:hypothetical protein [Amycolatopsis sp. YIM 10]|uniref:hypothetical protein n=1 Tax=Amycolatopsis sp. YIM 10 TaxID=2653857 RepID=UPI00128FE681|nr:hypothetical protein [Amycolatopsis sp. YIM 10]QFU93190.1 hypothetical protein YIM_40255 [Amycolatopsis sp. YIM 10]
MARTSKIAGHRRGARAAVALAAPIALLLTAAPLNAAPLAGDQWTVPLSSVDDNDLNVRYGGDALALADPAWKRTPDQPISEGYLVVGERALSKPANRITAELAANVPAGAAVDVDVRGHLGGENWTEWTPAAAEPAVLGEAVTTVQVRIGLYTKDSAAAPSVSSVKLTADEGPQARAEAAAARTYKVYATREGLVGGTTANGHVIKSRDHFVALPSRRGLAPKNTGDYTVRVCKTDNSRCEYAPVWDVGPWNTKDDYWNPSATRQMWKDLPQGKPEAQAAYQDNYNGGKDEFGREVGNPAGIDLADGTFWDGLKLTDNSWVNVSYLWTGSGPSGTVNTAGDPMNVRAGASTTAAVKGLAANKAKVLIECYVEGETVTGTYGTSNIWNRIGTGHYISDTYVYTGSDNPVAPKCA